MTVDGTAPFDDLTYLYGDLTAQNTNLHYSAATIKDAHNTQLNAEIAFGESFIKDIPVVGSTASTALSYDQQLQFLGVPQIPQFSTNNAQQAAAAGQATMSQDELMAMVPIVQGLAQGNVSIYTHDTGAQSVQSIGTAEGWYVNGKVVPNTQFWHWMGSAGGAWVKDLSSQGPDYTQSTINDKYQEWLSWMKLATAPTARLAHPDKEYQGDPAIRQLDCRFDALGGDAAHRRVRVERQQHPKQHVRDDVSRIGRDWFGQRVARPAMATHPGVRFSVLPSTTSRSGTSPTGTRTSPPWE